MQNRRPSTTLKTLCALAVGSAMGMAQASSDVSQRTMDTTASEQTAMARIQGSSEKLTYKVVDGYAIFGGDIVLGRHETIQDTGIPPMRVSPWTRGTDNQTQPTTNAAVAEGAATWPNGVVPYEFGGNFSSSFRQVVQTGMEAIEAQTDIRFVQHSDERNYVNIMRGSGCYSFVGMSGGAQNLSLGRGCGQKGVVIHELVHALGHFHEQSREDRDQYVTIQWNNIKDGRESQFRIQNEQNIGPYDYSSIMHYGAWAFSRNGEPTIRPNRDGVSLGDLGQREGLSDLDVAALNEIYGGPGNRGPELSLRHQEAVIFNTQSYELTVRLADDQTPDSDLNVSARSSNTTVLPNRNIEVNASTQSDERILAMTPNRQATGTAEVTITVTDGEGLSTSKTFTLTVKKDDGGTSDFRSLASMLNGQCLTVTGDASQDGALVELTECHGSESQKWTHNGSGQLRPQAASGKCLDVGNNPNWGVRARIRRCVDNAAHQQWDMKADKLVNRKRSDLVLIARDSDGAVFAWGDSGSYFGEQNKLWQWSDEGSGGGAAPCTDCQHITGSLEGRGDNDMLPDGTHYQSGSAGTHQGWLDAPDDATYSLTLYRWDGARWQRVARDATDGNSRAEVRYDGPSGYYTWSVASGSGAGEYEFWLNRPD
ncbi:M12 family metallopeptidase [Halomonadaceae bacterium KBTZ08]